jgi:hypothetical protein
MLCQVICLLAYYKLFPVKCQLNALGIDSTQYYVASATIAVLLLQVSVLVFFISHMGRGAPVSLISDPMSKVTGTLVTESVYRYITS